MGADFCNAARAMMFALGCIQALKCNTNKCPTGVTTQDEKLVAGLHVPTKTVRVCSYQQKTVESAMEIIGSLGLDHPIDLERHHINKRIDEHIVMTYAELYPEVAVGSLLNGTAPDYLQKIWARGGKILDKCAADKKAGLKPSFSH